MARTSEGRGTGAWPTKILTWVGGPAAVLAVIIFIVRLETRVSMLEANRTDLTGKYDGLVTQGSELARQGERIGSLEQRYQDLSAKYEDLDGRIQDLDRKLDLRTIRALMDQCIAADGEFDPIRMVCKRPGPPPASSH